MGFEPTIFSATNWRVRPTTLHPPYLARLKGLEPLTLCLEGRCSIQLSYRRMCYAYQAWCLERVMGIEPTQPAWKAGVLPLNYTRRCASQRGLSYHMSPLMSSTNFAVFANFSLDFQKDFYWNVAIYMVWYMVMCHISVFWENRNVFVTLCSHSFEHSLVHWYW